MTRTFAVRLDRRKYDAVARLARQRGATLSDAVREALDAWIDRTHADHPACVRILKDLTEPLAAVWPIVTEVMTGLRGLPKGQDVAWEMIERGAVQMLALDESDVPGIRALMRKHADRGMSFGD